MSASSAVKFGEVGNLGGYQGTDWAVNALTFTFGGLGSPTNVKVRTRRVGDTLQVRGKGTLGTVAGSTAYVQLPTGYTIDTAKLSASANQKVGMANQFAGSSTNLYQSGNVADIFYDGSTNNQLFICIATVSQDYQKQNGSTVWGSSNGFIFEFDVPIFGWTAGGSVVTASVGIYNNYIEGGSTNYWQVLSTTYADLSPGGTPILHATPLYNYGFGTVTIATGNKPGLRFTAPASGTIEFIYKVSINSPSSSVPTLRMVETAAATVLGYSSWYNGAAGGSQYWMDVYGVMDVTASTAYEVIVQGKSTSGTMEVGHIGANDTIANFAMKYIR